MLVPDTDKADLEQKIGDMKKKSALFENVSFAAGYSLPNSSRDIRQALSEADTRMYEDKEAFYRMNPAMKRR